MRRKTKLENKLYKFWNEFGTIIYSNIDELAYCLEEPDSNKVRQLLKKLQEIDKICLDFNEGNTGKWRLDYIPF